MNAVEELSQFEKKLREDSRMASILDAIAKCLAITPGYRGDTWYARFIPVFVLLTAQGNSKDLDFLTTLVEQEIFTRFYAELQAAYHVISNPSAVSRLPSKDERYINMLLKDIAKVRNSSKRK